MKLKCVDLRITNVNYFHICNLLAKQGLKICTTQISLNIILHLILYRSDFPFFAQCHIWTLLFSIGLKVEYMKYDDTWLNIWQVFLTASFMPLYLFQWISTWFEKYGKNSLKIINTIEKISLFIRTFLLNIYHVHGLNSSE